MISTALAFRHPSATQGVVDIRPVYKYSKVFLGIWWSCTSHAPLNQEWLYGLLRLMKYEWEWCGSMPGGNFKNQYAFCSCPSGIPLSLDPWGTIMDRASSWPSVDTWCEHLGNCCCFKPLGFWGCYPKIIHFLWDNHAQFHNLILKLWYRWNISAENILLGIPCWADGRDSVFTAVGLGLIGN